MRESIILPSIFRSVPRYDDSLFRRIIGTHPRRQILAFKIFDLSLFCNDVSILYGHEIGCILQKVAQNNRKVPTVFYRHH